MPSTWKVVSNMLISKLSGRNSHVKSNRVFFALHWYVFKFFKSYPRKKKPTTTTTKTGATLLTMCFRKDSARARLEKGISETARARSPSLGLPLHSYLTSFILRPLLAELLEPVAHLKPQHWEDVNAE